MTRRKAAPPAEPEAASLSPFDAAITEAVEAGANDPGVILDSLLATHGREWLVDALEEALLEIARTRIVARLSAIRRKAERSAEVTVRQKRGRGRGTRRAVAEATVATDSLADVPVQIPGRGWLRYGACTADDLRERGRMYAKIAGSASARADWCFGVADLMDESGAVTLADLAEIPPVPNGTSAEEILGADAVAA